MQIDEMTGNSRVVSIATAFAVVDTVGQISDVTSGDREKKRT